MAHPNSLGKIYFEDPHLIVLAKPAGLLSQGDSSGETSLVDQLRIHFGRNYVGLIHRLDRNTSGLMVIAKRSKSADRLSEQLRNGQLKRSYLALAWGHTPLTSSLRHFLVKHEKTNEVKVVAEGTPQSKVAEMHLRTLQTGLIQNHPISLVECELETGRSHQIRVQLHTIGHPLIGDRKYFIDKSMTLFHRPALHSSKLSFNHPMSHEPMTFEERQFPDLGKNFSFLK